MDLLWVEKEKGAVDSISSLITKSILTNILDLIFFFLGVVQLVHSS